MTYRPNFGLAICMAIAALVACLVTIDCAAATDQLTSGSGAKKLRKQTVNSIPYNQLNQQTKDKIGDILAKPSIYRRLPVTAINADADYFRFLVRYPEVIVNIWQLMGVTQMTTERTGPFTVSTNDGAGTISNLELVYGTENMHIFYGTGTYEGSVLKRKLTGKCVLVLRTDNRIGTDGKPVTTNQLDVFLKVENATAGLIAKTISPLVGTTADHNFVESLRFVERLNETTEKNGPGVQQMGTRLKIDDGVRQKFNQVVDVVFQRAIQSSAPTEGQGRVASGSQVTGRANYSAPSQPARSINSQEYMQQNYQAPRQKAPTQYQQPSYKQPNYQQPYQKPAPATGYEKLDFGYNATRGHNQTGRFDRSTGQNANLLQVYGRQLQLGSRRSVVPEQRVPAHGNQAPVYPQELHYDRRVQPASWQPQSSPQWHR